MSTSVTSHSDTLVCRPPALSPHSNVPLLPGPSSQQSEECIARSLREQQDNSSASRPAYDFDLSAATPGSIERLEWQKHGIDGGHHSPGGLGSLGVFLLNLKGEAGVIVMKQGSIQSASEYF